MDEIRAPLEDDFISRIGVYGIGGSGKTTIMKHIYNILLEDYSMPFSHIIWITVSQDHTITKLQHHLASRFNVILPQDEDEVARAASLYEAMLNTCYALILDDVWDKIDLDRVGIPEPSHNNGCKLIVTTRSLDVCRRMQCKPIFLGLLSEEEAWELFEKTLVVTTKNSVVEDNMKEVAKKCARLPLAIVNIAGSMRGIVDVHEWRNALDSLTKHMFGFSDMEKEVIEKLKFSFYRLSKQLQECLLVCALYPQNYKINKYELIRLLISEGTIENTGSLLSAFDHGCTILNKLENACLLMRGIDGFNVVMHDLVRDMCLDIAGCRFLVKCNLEFSPDKSKDIEKLEKVSLIGLEFEEIPSYVVPYGPKLSTLLLSENKKLTKIPNSFFMDLPSLKVLNLSGTSILELPNSVTNLVNLNVLVLQRCCMLTRLPCLASLRALKKLDLHLSGIEEAPEGLRELINLIYLDLSGTNIRILPRYILRNLVKLQVLHIGCMKITMDDVKELKNLESLDATFATLEDFNEFISSLANSKGPSTYIAGASCGLMSYAISRFVDGTTGFYLWGTKDERGNKINCTELMFPEDVEIIVPSCEFVEILKIAHFQDNCHVLSALERLTSSSQHMLPIHLHHKEKTEKNGELKGLLDAELLIAFSNLTDMKVIDCAFMELISTSPSIRVFQSSLKRIVIYRCHKMVRLLDPGFLSCFQNLEQIRIHECTSIESIIPAVNPIDKEETNNVIKLPKLSLLSLRGLPNLRSICGGNCPSIEHIHVKQCPNLKRLPLRLPVLDNNSERLLPLQSSLEIICGERTWWESLEWDHPDAKTLLQPYFKPCRQGCYADFTWS